MDVEQTILFQGTVHTRRCGFLDPVWLVIKDDGNFSTYIHNHTEKPLVSINVNRCVMSSGNRHKIVLTSGKTRVSIRSGKYREEIIKAIREVNRKYEQ